MAFAFVLFLMVLYSSSCKKNDFTPTCDGSTPTYDSTISSIINSSCTSSGCHGTGSSNGVFTSYTGIKSVLDNGKFEKEVLEKQSMPRGGSLTQDQLNQLQCWMEQGFKEK